MKTILHIATNKDWEEANRNKLYRVESLITEGFIHCSMPEQVIKVANLLFKGRTDLVLLSINPIKVKAEIKYEALGGVKENYPHIYGPLNLDAITKVYDFKPNPDGYYSLPNLINEK